jgi:glutathione synthase/RimK-type ligase-like ATP-grasp enzyme
MSSWVDETPRPSLESHTMVHAAFSRAAVPQLQSALVRIAFATTTPDLLKDEDVDRELHDVAFAKAGIDLEHRVWFDPTVPWSEYDLVVIRSPWDYVERLVEFREWLRAVDVHGILRNPASIVEWNLDKRYLLELHAEGLPVIPTQIISTIEEASRVLDGSAGQVVVKPVVSAGSRNTGRFAYEDPRALALAERILAEGFDVMVQPCVDSVAEAGETSAVLFNGLISHSFRKGAILALGGGFLGGGYTEQIASAPLTAEQGGIVERVAEFISDIAAKDHDLRCPLLYARIDLVRLDDGRDVVLEVELAEPSFFLSVDPDAPGRFVDAVVEHVLMSSSGR